MMEINHISVVQNLCDSLHKVLDEARSNETKLQLLTQENIRLREENYTLKKRLKALEIGDPIECVQIMFK